MSNVRNYLTSLFLQHQIVIFLNWVILFSLFLPFFFSFLWIVFWSNLYVSPYKTGKWVHQGCILSPCLTYMQSTSCEMLGWMNHKLESRLPGKITTPQICRWYHSNGRKQRGIKEPLDEGERGKWKNWFKTQYSKH